MRDKLIELISDVLSYLPWGQITTDTAKEVADHLIANGVTVREKGEWYGVGNMYMCDVCHEQYYVSTNFCPNCGADMRGKEHERKTD